MPQYDDREIEKLRERLTESMRQYYFNISDFIKDLSDKELTELCDYFNNYVRFNRNKEVVLDVNTDKMKVHILLFRKLFDSHDLAKVLSFLEPIEYGCIMTGII